MPTAPQEEIPLQGNVSRAAIRKAVRDFDFNRITFEQVTGIKVYGREYHEISLDQRLAYLAFAIQTNRETLVNALNQDRTTKQVAYKDRATPTPPIRTAQQPTRLKKKPA